MKNRSKYIGGSFIVMIGSILTVVGILLLIGAFLITYEFTMIMGSIALIIAGVIVAAVGYHYRGERKIPKDMYLYH